VRGLHAGLLKREGFTLDANSTSAAGEKPIPFTRGLTVADRPGKHPGRARRGTGSR
jgi:hypothetical protein